MSEPGDVCGFDDCVHTFFEHDAVRVDGKDFWPCVADDCNCLDFAQSGTVMSFPIPDQPGDPEGN